MNKWIKLDNVANVFPSVAKNNNSSIFRIAMVLKEPVRPALLQKALDKTLRRYPLLTLHIHKGLFWRYMEHGNKPFIIQKEEDYPCFPLQESLNKGHLIKIIYYNCRISLEVFHAMTDGNGAIEFLKTLVFEYLRLQGKQIKSENIVLLANEQPTQAEAEDGFHHYYTDQKVPFLRLQKAYQITGTNFEPFGHNVIHGLVSASELNKIAKKYQASITEFVVSLLIYMIYQQAISDNKKKSLPINVSIPVNLRKFFPTNSLRNFFTVTTVGISLKEVQTLHSIINSVKGQMKDNLKLDKLQNSINRNIYLEKILIARFIPLFIKDLIVRSLFIYYNDKIRTCTVTNLGVIKLPETMKEYIERMELVFYPTVNNPINCGICSVKDQLAITFARTIEENQIISNFFRFLAKECELEVKLYSNEWGINYK